MAIDKPNNPNEDKEKQEKLKALSEALGLNHFQAEIDSLKDNMGFVRGKLEESILRQSDMIDAVNRLTTASQGMQTPQVNPTAGSAQNQVFTKSTAIAGLLADPSAAAGLVSILEGLGKAYQVFRGNPQPQVGVDFATMGAEFMQLLM